MDRLGHRWTVVHVVAYFPPDRIGGVGEVVRHVHQGLLERGHRSVVLTSGRTHFDPTVIRIASTPGRFAMSAWRNASMVRGADILHIHHGEGLSLLCAMRLIRVVTPVLLTLHVSPRLLKDSMRPFTADGVQLGKDSGSSIQRNIVFTVRHFLDVGARHLANHTSYISRSAARDVLGSSNAESAPVVYNGVAGQGSPDRSADHVELLFVGTGSVRKRVTLLPLVLAKVRERVPTCRMRVIGFTPTPSSEFQRLAASLGLNDAFVLEGPLSSEDLARYYRSAKVLLVPSAYEGLPMVILEAYQQGLPCVATRVGGHAEVIEDGHNGFLVNVDSVEQMAQAVVKLLENPAMAQRMGEAGRQRVARDFSIDVQVSRYLELYGEVVAAHRTRLIDPLVRPAPPKS